MVIGVLCLQGAFYEHRKMFNSLGISTVELRKASDLDKPFDGLVIPGGESTVMGKLLNELGMAERLKGMIQGGLPVYGTCAGLILLAKKITNDSRKGLATMDISAERNAYGRQLGSFATDTRFKGIGTIPAVFIRAPYITEVWGDTEVLAEADGKIVAARENNQLVTAFHPELTDDLRIHEYFINMVKHHT
ncbi:MAG: pyridoxal 5'-phosphate synthase glutaminase subunit PdxT [Clostridia bacterium]|nr:pyridoxal 5'-phosphate synthase glutaminase subunit PdxT [Clostridia bacterium]